MTKRRYFFLILILGTLTALGPFSIDMYLPGFPEIAKDLNTTVAEVSLSLSSFFIGISAGQLLYGPLLDRFGRKKPLYLGLTLYIIATAGCMFSKTIDSLIILRFIQAIGSCAAAVASVAMVRDLFPVKDNAKVFALLTLVVGTSPMLAPTIGGYVTTAFGWPSVFLILMAVGLAILMASIFWLPASYKPDTTMSLKPKPIIKNFIAVIKEPQFFTYAVAGGVAFSGLLAYVSGSPLVFMDIFKVDGKTYGWIFAFLSIGLIGSMQVNSMLLRKYKSEQIVFAALIMQSVTGIIFLILSLNGWLNLTGTITLLFTYLCCLGLSSPNTSALSLAPFSKNAGSASSLLGAMQMGFGTLASAGVTVFNTHTTTPMIAIMAAAAILALTILLIGRRMIGSQVVVAQETAIGALH